MMASWNHRRWPGWFAFRARPSLVFLLVCTVLLGLLNCLVVNQKVVLYVFYLPVALAAWKLSRRDTVFVAIVAAILVAGYAVFWPQRLGDGRERLLLWMEVVVWGGILVVTALMLSTLRARVREAFANLERAYRGVLAILTRFIQTVDMDTEAHCVRVSGWAVRIAQKLALKPGQIEEVRIASLLHDVGKIETGVDLLRKAAALSEDEQAQMKEHTTRGAALVRPVGGLLAHIADSVESHHERFDGSGPMGLHGQEIPLVARIITVADAFDALLSDRPYRKGVEVFEALGRVREAAGSQFDPDVVAQLEEIVHQEQDEGEDSALISFVPRGRVAAGR